MSFSAFALFITGPCSRHIYSNGNYFYSPDFPSCYPNNQDCTWLLEAYNGQYIHLYFANFHLQYGGRHCPWDYVEIYDGSSRSSPLLVRACGQLEAWSFNLYSTGRFLLVRFHSDNSIQMPGFRIYHYSTSYSKRNNLP